MVEFTPALKIERQADYSLQKTERRWIYLVLILTVAYILSFVDRQVINILAEPIKRDLGLRDWQIGVMSGLSFALVYGVTALPIARLAERFDRSRLIVAALLVWSGSTLLCGAARGFGELAAARVAVGMGESGYTPSAQSLITQSVPKSRRTLALAVFGSALPIGSMIALAIGGLIADIWGWRMAFLLAGAPGLLVAIIIFLTVADPRRASGAPARTPSTVWSDTGVLLGKRSFLLFVLASGFFAMAGYGLQAFIASFFMRVHADDIVAFAAPLHRSTGLHLGEVAIIGPALGVIVGVAGLSSALLSGLLTDRLVARDVRYFSRMTGVPLLIAAPVLVLGLWVPGFGSALLCIAIAHMVMGLAGPPISSCLQSLAPPNMRATASALSLLALVMFGNGLGPVFVGVSSDLIASLGYAGGSALRVALSLTSLPLICAATLFLLARHALEREFVED